MSSALQAKKRKEAEENLKQAEKSLAKTMLRWAPDYLAAAPYLEKAADAYRAAGDLDAAKRVFTQAAGVQVKNKSSFRAAQNYENVAKVVVQQIRDSRAGGNDRLALLAEVKAAYDAASGHYGDMGELGKAADALMKSAACCEENGMTDMKQLRELYTRACSLMEAQDKPHFAVDPFRKTLAFMVKNAMYKEALELMGRLIAIFKQIDQHANVYKCYLSEIILILTMGDVALADKAYMRQLQEDAYLSADECALAEDLVRAYKMGNEELLQTTIRKQGFSFLDNQISRISRKLTIYGGASAIPAPASASSRTASGGRMPSQQQQRPPPARAAPSNPFSAPEPPAPAPKRTPVVVQPPAPAPVAPVTAPVAPVHEYDTKTTEEYDFDSTAARATVAFGGDVRGASAFDFESLAFAMSNDDSLEFAMPSEAEFDSHHSTATTESSYASETSAPQPAAARQQAPPPIMDDDMFDLT
ncbi:Gamma-soluble nsf attachment protein [Globisporangium polare]